MLGLNQAGCQCLESPHWAHIHRAIICNSADICLSCKSCGCHSACLGPGGKGLVGMYVRQRVECECSHRRCSRPARHPGQGSDSPPRLATACRVRGCWPRSPRDGVCGLAHLNICKLRVSHEDHTDACLEVFAHRQCLPLFPCA